MENPLKADIFQLETWLSKWACILSHICHHLRFLFPRKYNKIYLVGSRFRSAPDSDLPF